ncbi:MAG: hypothetical protein Q8L81_14275 [Bacteroidota bacterium]|nr:hypothetical protein [Bacteroidota bacterium]
MKISINEPCHEDWDKMTPNDKGAFCLACQKTVVDFSKQTIDEIKTFFVQKPVTESVCGRFREKQLHELSFDEFINEFMSWKFLKRAAVICFLVLGTTLFSSCSTEEKKQYEEHTAGVVAIDTTFKSLSVDTVCSDPPKLIKDTLKTKKATKETKKQKEKPQPVEIHMKGDVAVN